MNKKKPIIICIDDEVTVLDSLKIELKKALGDECIIETAEGGEDALELLEELLQEDCEVALVLADYIMPDLKGDEVLKRFHQMSPNTLKIMLTGQANLEAVSNAIKYARLYRYISKPWQSEDLKLTVVEALHSYLQDKKLAEQNYKLQQLNAELEQLTRQQATVIAERTAELEKANQELRRLAMLDGLTEIANRRRFDEYLSQEWMRSARERHYLSLILADVDYFKFYNDEYGHQAGDNCLIAVAKAMQDTVHRCTDLVARYGGEEFAVILPNTPPQGATKVAQRLKQKISLLKIPHICSNASQYVTMSMGIASLIPVKGGTPLCLINMADKALYKAKQQGRDRFILEIIQKNNVCEVIDGSHYGAKKTLRN